MFEVHTTDDNLVSKFVHNDLSETAIKLVPSCDTIRNPVTGRVEVNQSERNKYSLFVSSSVGCFMKCSFCYLTLKGMKYKPLNYKNIIDNLKEALVEQAMINPEIRSKYLKINWMGMGEDQIAKPERTRDITLSVLDWALENEFALGLDGVDIATVLPKVNDSWTKQFETLNNELLQYPLNPNNKLIVNSAGTGKLEYKIVRSPLRLFYSLHAARQELRNTIIPNSYDLNTALMLLKNYSKDNTLNVIFHIMFMEGINDSIEDIQSMINFIEDNNLQGYEFRVLRYNSCDTAKIRESTKFEEIVNQLANHVNFLKVQVSTGPEIEAACGQFIAKKLV
jgi:hypothetical protein